MSIHDARYKCLTKTGYVEELNCISCHCSGELLLVCLLAGDGEGDADNKDDDENDDDDDEEEQESTVMKFLPEDTAALDAMYQAMSQCQALNPDPNDSDSDPENIFVDADGDGGEEIEGGDQEGHGNGADDEDGWFLVHLANYQMINFFLKCSVQYTAFYFRRI